MSNHNSNSKISRINNWSGFSLVEMLVIAPIIILVIGLFISVIVGMTGDVLSTRSANVLTYDIQNALDKIKQDVKSSGAYLATNNIVLTSPQGYNNDTTIFHNANSDPTIGDILILNTYATTNNPLSSSRNIMRLSGQPNACNSIDINDNPPLMMNTIYFVKNNTLWRRIIVPSNYETIGCQISGSIGLPWQQPSCSAILNAFCKALDQRLVDGVVAGGFDVNYYVNGSTTANTVAIDGSQSDATRLAALQTTGTVSVSINATSTAAGRDVSESGVIREISPNNYILP